MAHTHVMRGLAVALVLAFGADIDRDHAQTVYGYDGSGVGAAYEATGPPAGPCGYPTGPVVSGFPTAQAWGCATPGPSLGVNLGDIAVDMVTDTVWVTDGLDIAGYTAAGAIFTAFNVPPGYALPGPITGMGWDSLGGVLWLTDGGAVVGIIPPPPPGCGVLPVIFFATFVPVVPPPGMMTDVEWDPLTGSLFACDSAGSISNFFPGGPPGPFAAFVASPGICGLGLPLTGLAVDTASGPMLGIPILYVTDGITIAYVDAAGFAAPLNFYTTANCIPTPAWTDGLAFAARPIAFGFGGDSTGLPAPSIGSVGQSVMPNPGFAVTISGSVPGSLALLYASTGSRCPAPLILAGIPLNITPAPPLYYLGRRWVGPAGGATKPLPLGGLPFGMTFYLQWIVVTPMPSQQSTPGLALTPGLP